MASYTARHAPRHAAPRSAGAGFSRAARSVLGRPVLASGAAAAVLTSGALVATLGGGQASAETLNFAVDGAVSSLSTEQLLTEQEDETRVASDRSATNTQRSVVVAREAERAKAAAVAAAAQRKAEAQTAARAAARKRIVADARKDPKAAARMVMPEFGFGEGQWSCLNQLWVGESGWKWNAENASSGAYGIPQSLPASKMATMGSDYRTNPVTQIRWGLNYIKKAYGTPCNALGMWNSRSPHWY